MTVWLACDAVTCLERNEDCGASDLKNHHHDVGPYVHIEQFMAEVEKRAAKLFGQSFHTATQADCFRQAVRELAKELKQ